MGQHMRMEQRLTPQLIQSMDILQLSTPALENRIAEELEKNVTLELIDDRKPHEGAAQAKPDENGAKTGEDTASFNRLDGFSKEYDLDFNERRTAYRGQAASGERDAKLDAMANTAARPEGIDDHLLAQWSLLDLDDDVRTVGETIIYHLDEDGYLRIPLDIVIERNRPPTTVETAERALKFIQVLDPVGIAARDIKECLLLQLDAMPGDNSIERVLIMNHLEDMARNRYPAIAKATGYSTGEITAAVEAIRSSLVLHPAYLVVEKRVPRVYPDAIIDHDEKGKGYVVRLTRGNLPELRVKKEFITALKDKSNKKEMRDFVRKQVENASTLIEAVKFRRSRLLDVARAVVVHQADFLEQGPPGLKVLRMSDLAEEMKCDPSTISRTVADKYVETPHGVFPLRYFFTGGTSAGNGQDTSWDSIKTRVSAIVKDEDSANPLNDDQIAAALAKESIKISRRTVAKYRAQLKIPAARQRRKY
jgi:RNA polymerase sigma-54 factor